LACRPPLRAMMFLEWFDVRVVDLVYDLGEGILDHDD
jgi:hypothetical protein